MRILLVTNLYPPLHLGGYERRCAEVAAELRRRGHDVHVLTGRFGLRGESVRDPSDTHVTRGLHVAHGPPYPPEALGALLETAAADRALAARVIEAFEPDVIDIWGMDGAMQPLVSWLANCGVPAHFTVEDVWLCEAWKHDALGQIAHAANELRAALPDSIRTLCGRGLVIPQIGDTPVTFVSQALRSHYAARGFEPANTCVRLAGLDLSTFQLAAPSLPPPYEILAAGQLTIERDFEGLIAAVHRVTDMLRAQDARGTPIRLRIFGGGSAAYTARLRSLATAAQDAAADLKIELGGIVPPAALRDALAASHIFVHPSRLPEGLPRVLVEAIAAGVPVVASDSGGQRDVLENGRYGRLYSAGNADALANALRSLLLEWHRDPAELRAAASKASDAALRKFDFDQYVDRHTEALRAAATRTPRVHRAAEHTAIHLTATPITEFVSDLTEAALRAFRDAAVLDGDALYRIAIVLKRAARLDAAAAAFERLFARGRRSAIRRSTFHLGEISLAQARWRDAEFWLRMCLESTPDHAKAADVLANARERRTPPHLKSLQIVRECGLAPRDEHRSRAEAAVSSR